jgi:YHS domain-containing protein
MPDISELASRLDAEFSAVKEKVKKVQAAQLSEYKERQERVAQLGKVLDELQQVWRPRLELLAKKFEGNIQTTPRIVPTTREATFTFQSRLAHVRLKLGASTDRDVRKVILSYDLEIIPILMHFKPHSELEFPLDGVDHIAVGKWLDDCLVEFVQTYFALGENEIYLKDDMVEDPIAHVRFPRDAAAATLERSGQKFYFISDETRREFAEKNRVA